MRKIFNDAIIDILQTLTASQHYIALKCKFKKISITKINSASCQHCLYSHIRQRDLKEYS